MGKVAFILRTAWFDISIDCYSKDEVWTLFMKGLEWLWYLLFLWRWSVYVTSSVCGPQITKWWSNSVNNAK